MVDLAGSCRLLCPTLAAILAIASSDASRAAQRADNSARLVVGDLDFSSARDVELFRRRVDKVERSLCRRESQLDFLEMSACYRLVRDQCLRKLSDGQRRELLATSDRIRMWWGEER
jgi:UrcA family protein